MLNALARTEDAVDNRKVIANLACQTVLRCAENASFTTLMTHRAFRLFQIILCLIGAALQVRELAVHASCDAPLLSGSFRRSNGEVIPSLFLRQDVSSLAYFADRVPSNGISDETIREEAAELQNKKIMRKSEVTIEIVVAYSGSVLTKFDIINWSVVGSTGGKA